MARKEIADFKIERLEILDKDGEADEELMPNLSEDQIKEMYYFMVLSREFDDKALKLQRQGRLGTYASGLGQEASHVGTSYALNEDDWMTSAFRENASYITRGIPMVKIYQYWGGDERGNALEGNNMPVSIPVGSQPLHGAGLGWGLKLQGKKAASLIYFGDGATSEGDFHEAMNFAGTFKVNSVFVCMNNKYAISVPREKQTAAETIAQKAVAYGFKGIQVDGNDIFAVYSATQEALERARNGEGPTLIECDTYRRSDHTTADDASRYRDEEEVKKWKEKDPVDRLRKYMINNEIWDEEKEKELLEKVEDEVAKAVEEYESVEPADPTDMMKYLYADMTPQLEKQAEELKKYSDNLEHKEEIAAKGETGVHEKESEREEHIEESEERSDNESKEDESVSVEESKGE